MAGVADPGSLQARVLEKLAQRGPQGLRASALPPTPPPGLAKPRLAAPAAAPALTGGGLGGAAPRAGAGPGRPRSSSSSSWATDESSGGPSSGEEDAHGRRGRAGAVRLSIAEGSRRPSPPSPECGTASLHARDQRRRAARDEEGGGDEEASLDDAAAANKRILNFVDSGTLCSKKELARCVRRRRRTLRFALGLLLLMHVVGLVAVAGVMMAPDAPGSVAGLGLPEEMAEQPMPREGR
uniref:Uncharacterized protein n=1 Tax=Alexandrium monilatum TaxID=311494 RepID=A0A7S4V4L8_9DINO